jgi:type II secretory pathway pseudopilin PulG
MAHRSKSQMTRNDVRLNARLKDRGERGDTLIEVLMALLVLGLTALALIIAFSTSVSASQRHRDIATANIVLGTASQQALAQIQQNPNFFGCQAPGVTDTAFVQNNVTLSVAPNVYDGFTAQIDSIQYWNGTTFQTACVPDSNPPLQVVIEVDGNGEKYFNTFVVDLPSGNLGIAADTSNGVISQSVFENQQSESATGSSGVPFSPQPKVAGLDSTDQVVRKSNAVAFILQIEGNPANATLSGCNGNDPNGDAIFTGCIITGPAGTYHVHVIAFGGIPDSDPNGNAQNTNSFHGVAPLGFWETSPTWYATTFTVVLAGTPDKVVFVNPAPAGGLSGQLMSHQPQIQIDTSSGIKDTTQNGTVTLTLTGGSMTGCTSVNGPVTTSVDGETITAAAHAGLLALANCSFSGAIFFNGTASPAGPDATNYTITASYPSAASTSSQLAVSAPGPASQLVFIQQPSGVSGPTKTAVFPVQPQVEIEDAFGNPAYTPTPGTVKIAFDPSDVVHEVLGGCSGSMVANTAIEVFSGCSGSAYGGNLEFLATYNGLTVDSSRFAISSGVGSIKFTISPVAGPSGSAFTTQPEVTIFDNATPPNIDTGYSGSITLTTNAGTLSGCTSLTPNNGVVDVATCLFSGNAGTSYQLTASIVLPPPPVGGTTISAVSNPFSPSQAGAATKLQFTNTVAAGATAGSLMATQPIVRIEDSQGNVVTNSTPTITLTSSGGTLAGCANLTAVAGVVNTSGCTFGGLIGSSYTLTASSGGLTSAVSNSFSSPGAAGTESGVLISALPSTVPVSNVTNVQLTLQVVDSWGNPTVSNGTTTLFLSASPTTKGFFSLTNGTSGPLGVTENVTIPAGSASVTIFYGDESVGSPQITAFDSQTSIAFGSASLAITPDVPTQLVYSTGPPSTTNAGTVFPVSVLEEDQFGNTVATDSTTVIALSANNGTSNGGFNCASPTTATVTAGVATFTNCSYTSASTTAYTLTAASPGLASAAANTTVSAGAAAKVFVWGGNNQSTKINTAFVSPLSALVTDASGNPVAGATVTFTNPASPDGRFRATANNGVCLAAGGIAVTACTATTNAAGIASSLTFTAFTTPGQYNVTASIPGPHSATFVETNTSTVLVFLTGSQEFATPTNTSSGSVVIQEQDGAGNPIVQATNLTVNLTYNKPGTVTGPATVVIPAGASTATFTMTAASATATTFTVTASNVAFTSVAQTETVDPTVGAINTTVAVTGPQAVSATGLTTSFPVLITNTSAGFTTLRYSVAGVNGDFSPGESEGPSNTCVQVTRGNHTTINETFTASSSRPSGAYTLGFVVDVYTGNNCNGNPNTIYVGDATLNVTTRASEIDVNGGYAQTAVHGAAFASALSAVVTDGAGNNVAGVIVTFTAPTTGPSGTFLAASSGGTCLATGGIAVTSCTATTNANGVASSLTFTANAITGSYGVGVTTPFALPSPLVFEEENQ